MNTSQPIEATQIASDCPFGWRVVPLSSLCKLQRGFDLTEATSEPGTVPVYSSSGVAYFTKNSKVRPPAIVTGRKGLLGKVYSPSEPFWPHDTTLWGNQFGENSPKFVAYALGAFGLEKLDAATSVPTLNRNNLHAHEIAIPKRAEQEAIAEALSDADALIEGLERLIAKKRLIKQGAMQDLLTAKRRLPGFSGEWVDRKLGEVARIATGSRNNQDKDPMGDFPFFVRSDHVEQIRSWSYDCEAILVPGEGRIGEIFHYINGKFDVHQRVYCISGFAESVSGRFVHTIMRQFFGKHAMTNTVKATVDSLRRPTFTEFGFMCPPSLEEQRAIANVLTDMDAEIQALDTRLEKARSVKEGMMQNLLTGRIRLV